MLVKMKCLKLIILKQVKENSCTLLEILINTSLVILKDMMPWDESNPKVPVTEY